MIALDRYVTSIILQVAYGLQIKTDDDPFVKITLDAGYAIANGGPPGSTPIDFFPFRKRLSNMYEALYIKLTARSATVRHLPSWFPGCHYAGFARDNKFAIDALINYPYDQVIRLMVRVCFLACEPHDNW